MERPLRYLDGEQNLNYYDVRRPWSLNNRPVLVVLCHDGFHCFVCVGL
jgi:hypothetical protein